MAKYSVNISGDSTVGSIAVGPGATAVGSVTRSPTRDTVPGECSHCHAPYEAGRVDCRYCKTAYPKGVGANVGSVTISYED